MKRLPLLIFLVGMLSAGLWVAGTNVPVADDAAQYAEIAGNIAAGRGFSDTEGPTMLREPGYPVFLSGVMLFTGGSLPAAKFAQAALIGLVAMFAYLLAARRLPMPYAVAAGFTVAVLPQISAYGPRLLSEPLAAVLMLLGLLMLDRMEARPKIADTLLTGTVLGMLVLTRAAALPLLPIAALLFGRRLRSRGAERPWRCALMLLASGALVILPWMLRNEAVFGRFQIASRGGLVAYVRASRTEFSGRDRLILHLQALFGDRLTAKTLPDVLEKRAALDGAEAMWSRYQALRKAGRSDAEIDLAFGGEAVRIVLRRPFAYLADFIQEFFLLNMIAAPYADTRALFAGTHPELPEALKDAVVILLRFLNFALIALIAWSLWRSRKTAAWFWPAVFIVYWNLIHMAVDAIPRYAVPILPLYAIFAAEAVRLFKTRAAEPLPPAVSRTRREFSS